MNKNGDSATMYGTMPAVAGLNRVEGFEPSGLLVRTVSPMTGEEGLEISLACKKLWFRLAYPKGRLQTDRVSLTEQVAVFEARVYLDCSDAEPVSSFVSGCTREDANGVRYIQAAQDEAMDRALTDAGFGLQFADMCADSSMAGNGEKPVHPGTGDAAIEKGSAGNIQRAGSEVPVGNAGTAGPVAHGRNASHAGNVVRPFPEASASGGTKKVPAQGPQPSCSRQPAQAATVPQGHAQAGTGQPVRTAAMTQGQAAPAGTGQPAHAAIMPQSQTAQPVGTRQPVLPVAFQGKTSPTAGTGQPIAASVPQGQRVQPIGGSLGAMPVMPQKQEAQSAGGGRPVGNGKAAQTVMPQGQGVTPAGNRQPTIPIMPQGQGMEPGRNGNLTQPAAPVSAAAGKAASGGAQLGETARDSTISGVQAATQNPAMEKPGKPDQPTGDRPTKGQRYFGNTGAASAAPQNQTPHNPMTAQPAQSAAHQEIPGQLPVPPASMEGKGAVRPDSERAADTMDSLPVPPMGITGQASSEAARSTEDALPVSADAPEKRNARSSIQEAMALLKGNVLPVGTAESTMEGGGDSAAENAAGNTAAGSVGDVSTGSQQPVNGEAAQGKPAPRYTPDMSVEEIVSLMTLEEAGKVVVDTGVSKGQTIAEVAERRPPSLKYYRYGGYDGPNNILRAAAQVMLDSIKGQKAS